MNFDFSNSTSGNKHMRASDIEFRWWPNTRIAFYQKNKKNKINFSCIKTDILYMKDGFNCDECECDCQTLLDVID